MRRPRAPLAVLAAVVLVAVTTGVARAHELTGSRFEAPVPLAPLLVGAGLTVAATAAFLAASRSPRVRPLRAVLPVAGGDAPTGIGGGGSTRTPTGVGEEGRPDRRLGTVPPSVARPLRLAASVGFLALFVGMLAAGLVGSRSPLDNPLTLFVWAVWFKGLGLVSALAGSPWRVLSPWRTLYRGFVALEGRTIALRSYPTGLGHWPAFVGFVLLFGVVENLTVVPRTVSLTVLVVAGYALVMLAGGLLFGPVWFDRADPLSVLYGLFGRVAPLHFDRRDDGGSVVRLRAPWPGGRPVPDLAVSLFVVAAVYTVSFDGFDGTPEYRTLADASRELTGLGAFVDLPLYLGGLALFLATFALVARPADRAGAGLRAATIRLAPTVLPIAVAYEVAHNYPYALSRAGRLLGTLVGWGGEPLAWLPLSAFWASQVALVVAGHVVAVVAVHVALRGRPHRTEAPLTGAMIGYTMLSLWIISRPVVA
jgi:hypothetical protein